MFVGMTTDVVAVHPEIGGQTLYPALYGTSAGEGVTGSFGYTAPPGADYCIIHFRIRLRGAFGLPWFYLPGVTPDVDPVWGSNNAIFNGNETASGTDWRALEWITGLAIGGPASELPFSLPYELPWNGTGTPTARPAVVATTLLGFAADPPITLAEGGGQIANWRPGGASQLTINPSLDIPPGPNMFDLAVEQELAQITWSSGPSPTTYEGPFTGVSPPGSISAANGWTQVATSTNWPPMRIMHRNPVPAPATITHALFDQGVSGSWATRIFRMDSPVLPRRRRGPRLGFYI